MKKLLVIYVVTQGKLITTLKFKTERDYDMRVKNRLAAATMCLLLSLVMIVCSSAATLDEMYENGVVSDGDVSFGDIRDGIVSDVSEGEKIFGDEGAIDKGIDRMLGRNGEGTDSAGTRDGTDIFEEPDLPATTDAPKTDAAPETRDTTNTTTDSMNNDDGGSMATGIIIAVIVVIAVIVIIFLVMPKRK